VFLTTIRVRRARRTSLDERITNTEQLAAARGRDCVEVLAHGQVVAIASLTSDGGAVLGWEWTHPELGQKTTLLGPVVKAALPLMDAVRIMGMAARPEAVEASPASVSNGRSRRRAA
jgi:hypothetical protein